MLRHWGRPGSLPFFVLLLVLFTALSLNRTARTLRHNFLEANCLDIVSHAVMVHWEAHALPPSLLGYEQTYPKLSHALAARLTPWFDGNAIQAMRCAALIAIFTMFSAQYTLLCRCLRAAPALLGLLCWQWLCNQTKFGNTDHFDNASYLFAQAVGVAGFWATLVLGTTPAPGRAGQWLIALGAFGTAWFAYACHLVPGVLAFGTLAAFHGLRFLQSGERASGLRLVLTVAGAALIVSTSAQWKLMAEARKASTQGWLPLAHLEVLVTWVPTLVLAVVRLTRGGCGRPVPRRRGDLELILAGGLLAAGLLQAYFAFEWLVLGTTCDYVVKKLFFFNFPLAALLWLVWLAPVFGKATLPKRLPAFLQVAGLRVVPAAAVVLTVWVLRSYLYRQANWPAAGKGRDPVFMSRLLDGRRQELARSYYHDPKRPLSSLFATMTGLQLNRDLAVLCWQDLTYKNAAVPIGILARDGHVVTVLLPRGTDAGAALGLGVPVVDDGTLMHCSLSRVNDPYPPVRNAH